MLDINLPVFNDCVGHRALGGDVSWQVQVFHITETGFGTVEQEGREAFEVVVSGGDSKGETGHPRHEAVHIFRVGTILAKQLWMGREWLSQTVSLTRYVIF